MRASYLVWGLAFLLLISGSATAQPQSLAEAARKAEAERKAAKAPGKVYTNDDLKRFGSVSPPPPAAAGEASRPTPPAVEGQPVQPGPEASAQTPAEQQLVKDEAWWRKNLAEARGKLESSRAAVEALDNRIYTLQVDFYNRSEQSERDAITREIEKAMAEKDKNYREMEEATATLAGLEEEGRRARVPPGWLR
jgi:hypothetical protein